MWPRSGDGTRRAAPIQRTNAPERRVRVFFCAVSGLLARLSSPLRRRQDCREQEPLLGGVKRANTKRDAAGPTQMQPSLQEVTTRGFLWKRGHESDAVILT